jgi:hypothetical protein
MLGVPGSGWSREFVVDVAECCCMFPKHQRYSEEPSSRLSLSDFGICLALQADRPACLLGEGWGLGRGRGRKTDRGKSRWRRARPCLCLWAPATCGCLWHLFPGSLDEIPTRVETQRQRARRKLDQWIKALNCGGHRGFSGSGLAAACGWTSRRRSLGSLCRAPHLIGVVCVASCISGWTVR